MKSNHGKWPFSTVRVHGPTSMVRLLKKLVLKSLGPSLGANQMWTKKNYHAPRKWMCWFFIIHAQKRQFWKNNSCLTILLSSLGLHLSSLLVKCVEDVACKSFTTFSTKKNEWLNLYMWHVPCVVTTLNRIFSVCLNSILLLPYLAQH